MPRYQREDTHRFEYAKHLVIWTQGARVSTVYFFSPSGLSISR
jgi:hypothetical protein